MWFLCAMLQWTSATSLQSDVVMMSNCHHQWYHQKSMFLRDTARFHIQIALFQQSFYKSCPNNTCDIFKFSCLVLIIRAPFIIKKDSPIWHLLCNHTLQTKLTIPPDYNLDFISDELRNTGINRFGCSNGISVKGDDLLNWFSRVRVISLSCLCTSLWVVISDWQIRHLMYAKIVCTFYCEKLWMWKPLLN